MTLLIFSKRFIKIISKIIALFILILQIIIELLEIDFLSFKVDNNKYNKKITDDGTANKTSDISNENKNLFIWSKVWKAKNSANFKSLTNSKKPDLIKLKMSNLEEVKNSNFSRTILLE